MLASITLACAAAPPAEPEPPPQVSRDLFPEMSRRMAEEMEAQRQQALGKQAAGADTETDALDLEMERDALQELGATGVTGCFTAEEDFAASPMGWVRHRKLEREDFQDSQPPRTDVRPGGNIGAIPTVIVTCTLELDVEEVRPGYFTTRLGEVRYTGAFSRAQSWWNPDAALEPEAILRHAQLHLDIAQLIAAELQLQLPAVRQATRGLGRTAQMAAGEFQRKWAEHMLRVADELHTLERTYDEQTAHGNRTAAQLEWQQEIERGLPTLRHLIPRTSR